MRARSAQRARIAELARLSPAEIEAALIADCALRGACAALLGRRADENPWPRGTLERRAWARGLRGQALRELKALLGDETIRPKKPFHVEQNPGRGRCKLGRRSEWSDGEKAAALSVRHQLSSRWIGRLIGKTDQAVRNKFYRIDKERAET